MDAAHLPIEMMVLEILEFYGQEWSRGQLKMFAEMFYQEYHFATVSELKLFSARVRSGWFGKTFHKLMPNILLEHAVTFFDDQLEARAMYRAGQRKQLPAGDNYVDPAKVSAAMKDFQAELEAKLKEEDDAKKAARHQNDVKAYAMLNQLNWDEIEKNFGFKKKKKR
jgi:hypothetical protein